MNPDQFPLFPSPFFAGLVTQRLAATWDFYTELLGFSTLAEGGTWVRLLHPCGAQLLLTAAEAVDTPAELVSATNGCGWWLTLEVADVATERARLTAAGVKVEMMPRNSRWPREAIGVRDPMGVWIVLSARESLVRRIPPLASVAA